MRSAAEGQKHCLHTGKKIKGCSRHVAIDGQGTLPAIHMRAANKAGSSEA